jgi:hypothetical protein
MVNYVLLEDPESHNSPDETAEVYRYPSRYISGDSMLLYIYGLCTSMELNPLPVAPLVLKFGIHLGQAGRKGV